MQTKPHAYNISMRAQCQEGGIGSCISFVSDPCQADGHPTQNFIRRLHPLEQDDVRRLGVFSDVIKPSSYL
jgi:hypothetical protein